MAFFSERMKAFADQVSACRRERAAAVAGVKEHTGRALEDARKLVRRVEDENRQRGRECRAALAAGRCDRSEDVRAFRAGVRQAQQQARGRMRAALDQHQRDRQGDVGRMLRGFGEARQALANDFRAAAQAWRNLQNVR